MDQKQFEGMLSDAETRLRRLKTLYDQWLAGFERMEPAVARRELDDLFVRLKREQIRNTALRFRLQQVHQRYMTFTTYWKRLARQIEEGTYQRDVLKARRAREDREDAGREGGDGAYEVDVDVDLDAALAAAAQAAQAPASDPAPSVPAAAASRTFEQVAAAESQAASAPPAANSVNPAASAAAGTEARKPPPIPARPPVGPRSISPFALPLPPSAANKTGAAPGAPSKAPPPVPPGVVKPNAPALPAALRPPPAQMNKPAQPAAPANAPGALSSDDVQRIYARYVAARKDNAERVDNVRIENIEKSLRGMLPQLEKKHAGKKIDFEVVVKDGKVALKPVAK